jgi:hypothetical protein
MSFPRLALLALGLPLLTGACAGAAATAVSYGADGVSLAETGKSTADHLTSIVSKKDCAFWRVFRNQSVCRERDGDKDPYKVDYDSAERQPSEDGVAYVPPLRAASDTPATSWTADAYKEPAAAPTPTPEPAAATAETTSPPPPAAAPKAVAHKTSKSKKKPKVQAKVKKASPSPEASVP